MINKADLFKQAEFRYQVYMYIYEKRIRDKIKIQEQLEYTNLLLNV